MSSFSSPNRSESSDPMRNAVRFPLRLPVRIEIEGKIVEAVTEDISATGVLFIMPNAPAINTRLSWTLCLPAEVMGAKEDVTVSCLGRVVWHRPMPGGSIPDGPSDTSRQVGVVIDDYRIGDRSHE